MNVTLNGYVVSDEDQWLYDWFGFSAFSPGIVRKAIQDNPEGENLVLEINSGGGSAFAGFEIYSILRAAKCHTVAQVQSVAASAASTVMVGCNECLLSPVAQVMIHLPALSTRGDQNAHRESINILDSITQSILNGYELRCKGKTTRAHLEELMAAETWLPAQHAVELGLADGILYQDGEAELPATIINAVGGGIRGIANSAGQMPDTVSLRAEYQRMVANGATPAEGHPAENSAPTGKKPENDKDAWRADARLAIERMRFM